MLLDLKYSLRSLLRAPGLLIPAGVCLALGIGVNAAMLGALDALLVRAPVGVEDVDSLKRLYFLKPSYDAPQSECSYPIYADLAGEVDAFSGLAAYTRVRSSLGLGEAARAVWVGLATSNFFPVLGVSPARGRLFLAAEGDPRRPGLVALVSWELWQRELGGAPDVLGRALPIGRQTCRAVSPASSSLPWTSGCPSAPWPAWVRARGGSRSATASSSMP